MFQQHIRLLVSIAFATTALACSGDDGNRGLTSVDRGRALSSLADNEALKYCHDVRAVADKRLAESDRTIGCTGAAAYLYEGKERAVCELYYDRCMSTPPKPPEETEKDECASFADDVKGCKVTVEEYEACVESTIDALRKFGELGKKACTELPSLTITTPACDALKAKCPRLLDTTDPSASG
jgi:hypothetical protein